MSIIDKLKGLLRGNKDGVEQGIDKSSDVVEDKVGEQHAAKVEDVAEKANDTVDRIAPPEGPDRGTGAQTGA